MKALALILGLMIATAIGFSWLNVPACMTTYTATGYNFTYANMNQTLCQGTTTAQMQGVQVFGQTNWQRSASACVATTPIDSYLNSTHRKIALRVNDADSGYCEGVTKTITATIALPSSGNHTLTVATGTQANDWVKFDSTAMTGTISILELNATTYNITNGTASITEPRGGNLSLSFSAYAARGGEGISSVIFPTWTPTAPFELAMSTNLTLTSTGDYIGADITKGTVVHSDIKTGVKELTSYAAYCRTPMYYQTGGGLTLIFPDITYFPGTDAFASFYNATTQEAYFLNNTAAYILDITAGRWYYLAPTTCTPGVVYPGGIQVVLFSTTSTDTTDWGYYNGSTASMAGGHYYCQGLNSTIATKIRVRTASTTGTNTYTLNLLNSSGDTIDTKTAICQDCITEFTINASNNAATNVSVKKDGVEMVNMWVENLCSPAMTAPNSDSRGNLVFLSLLLVVVAVALETWLGFGFWTFVLGGIFLGMNVSTGFIGVGLIFGLILLVELIKELWK